MLLFFPSFSSFVLESFDCIGYMLWSRLVSYDSRDNAVIAHLKSKFCVGRRSQSQRRSLSVGLRSHTSDSFMNCSCSCTSCQHLVSAFQHTLGSGGPRKDSKPALFSEMVQYRRFILPWHGQIEYQNCSSKYIRVTSAPNRAFVGSRQKEQRRYWIHATGVRTMLTYRPSNANNRGR